MGVGMILKVGRLKASSASRRRRRTEMPKASKGWRLGRGFPLPNMGVGGVTPGKFCTNLYANWCSLERKSLMNLIGQIKYSFYYNVGVFELDDSS